jgi:phosphoglycolate phosphatase
MTPPAWDSYDAYLFDIDGTLLNCLDAVHYFAFCDALSMVAGRSVNLDGVVTHGNVDVAILRDAWALADCPEAQWRPRLDEAIELMGNQVARNQGDLRIDVLPGVESLLKLLQARGALLGVATGNLAAIGKVKLAHCGLLQYLDIGGFSDAHESRAEVFRAAAEQVLTRLGPQASICVFGDTPADIHAAQQNGLDVIAVATGIFSRDALEALNPTRTLTSLTELLPAPASASH